MRIDNLRWLMGLTMAVAVAGCIAAERKQASQGEVHAGWYMEHAGRGMFQPCGQSQQWRVSGSADLRAKAMAFDLQPDTPVYVRLLGVRPAGGGVLEVARVEQFGSATPVRNCGLTGVVIPAPSD